MTTLNLTVPDGDSDGREAVDDTGFNSVFLSDNCSSSTSQPWLAFKRFDGATMGQGDSITSADFQPNVHPFFDDINVDIHCEDTDTSVDLSSDADIANRTLTATSTAWVGDSIGGGYHNNDIQLVVQEVVNRGGYGSSALAVIVKGRSDVNKTCFLYAYDNLPLGSKKAKLDIVHEAGGGGEQYKSNRLLMGAGL